MLAQVLEEAGQTPMHDQLCAEAERLEAESQQAIENANLVGERLGIV